MRSAQWGRAPPQHTHLQHCTVLRREHWYLSRNAWWVLDMIWSSYSYLCWISPTLYCIYLKKKTKTRAYSLLTATLDYSCSLRFRPLHFPESCFHMLLTPKTAQLALPSPAAFLRAVLLLLLLFFILHICHGKDCFKCTFHCQRRSFPNVYFQLVFIA